MFLCCLAWMKVWQFSFMRLAMTFLYFFRLSWRIPWPASGIWGKIQPSGAQNTVFDAWETSKMCSTNILNSCCNFICGLLTRVVLYFRQINRLFAVPCFPWDRRCWSVSATGCYNNNNNQPLFVLILAKEKEIGISMKILKVIIRVLAAWNNHRG